MGGERQQQRAWLVLEKRTADVSFDKRGQRCPFRKMSNKLLKAKQLRATVHTPYTTNLVEGFRRHKEISLNEELISVYESWIKRILLTTVAVSGQERAPGIRRRCR